MRALLAFFLLLSPGLCRADVFILNDGGRIEGEVTGEMEGVVMVKTKYGSLTINRSDIREQQAAPAPAPAAPPAEPAPAPAEAALSTQAPAALSGAAAASAEPAIDTAAVAAVLVAPPPKLTFRTVLVSTAARLLVYAENGVAVATETYGADGSLLAAEGAAPDGTYTEYYDGGGLKTVRTMMGGKANGTLKAYYPSGALQAEAYYFVGGREGPFKYFTEDGKPLMTAEYKNDRLNGWKKDYGPDGALTGETYYLDGVPAAPPGTQAATAAESALISAGRESPVTVRSVKLTRGERFEFRLDGRRIGMARLDKEFNLIELEGKIPDGVVKAYSKDGRLQKEFVFLGRELKALRVYEEGGPLKAEYDYVKDKAVKK